MAAILPAYVNYVYYEDSRTSQEMVLAGWWLATLVGIVLTLAVELDAMNIYSGADRNYYKYNPKYNQVASEDQDDKKGLLPAGERGKAFGGRVRMNGYV